MKHIYWGMIGCGDVTELKSGPAFNKVPHSSLHAVMGRSLARVKDYALRHNVSKFYGDIDSLLKDEKVNAIYIATPPSTHIYFALRALEKNLPVYIEKPMCLNEAEAQELVSAVNLGITKFSVAHYRRGQPKFLKIKSMLSENAIGRISNVNLQLSRTPLKATDLAVPKTAWRVDPAIAGGGLFHDLAPHQLDLLLFFFGEACHVSGVSRNVNPLYSVPDIVEAVIEFKNGIKFSGTWNFHDNIEEDKIIITGAHGTITFSAFGKNEIIISRSGLEENISFEALQHVQQPMIDQVVKYFLGEGPNPCTVHDAAIVMTWIGKITA